MSKAKTIDSLEFAFDAGEDMSEYFDFDNPTFPNRELKRVNVDFPQWMVAGLDAEASRNGTHFTISDNDSYADKDRLQREVRKQQEARPSARSTVSAGS